MRHLLASCALGSCILAAPAMATDIEVTHWWTSGGEAAAVRELARVFEEQTGDKWVDGAIAGSGNTARPIMISRITGGDPMGATQFNHGRQAEELIEAGLMRDITQLADEQHWRDVIYPASLLDSCTYKGKVYCAPVDIHSWQWLWLSKKAYEDAGLPVPTNWQEFVASAPALEKAGKIPLAMGKQGWQESGLFSALMITLLPDQVYLSVYKDKDAKVAAGPNVGKVFAAIDTARKISANSNVQDWNQATNLVLTGQAGGQVMGDWAQGEFALAGKVAGQDYDCLPGLGEKKILTTGGDAFYFPKVKDDDVADAQVKLASVIVSPEAQVAFNLKKGGLPIRSDVDLKAANACMKKGLEVLHSGNTLPDTNQLIDADTTKQIEDLMVQFFSDASMTPAEAQKRFAGIIGDAQ